MRLATCSGSPIQSAFVMMRFMTSSPSHPSLPNRCLSRLSIFPSLFCRRSFQLTRSSEKNRNFKPCPCGEKESRLSRQPSALLKNNGRFPRHLFYTPSVTSTATTGTDYRSTMITDAFHPLRHFESPFTHFSNHRLMRHCGYSGNSAIMR